MLALVAARWPGSDHDEAVDLWNLVPAIARGDGPPLTLVLPRDATIVRGTIVSSSCDKSGLNLVLQPIAPNTPVLKLGANKAYESGFSDTLWFGEDHYTPCFHLAGLPALVAYRASGAGTEKLLALEVRDDLPRVDPPITTSKTAEPRAQ